MTHIFFLWCMNFQHAISELNTMIKNASFGFTVLLTILGNEFMFLHLGVTNGMHLAKKYSVHHKAVQCP